jgi:DNA-binding LacI/PurR family transcriptional regulator
VPDEVSVVGYDDSAFMNGTEPPLTTVRQPIEPMGRAAIDLLVGLTTGSKVTQDELLFEPELVVRGCTAPALTHQLVLHTSARGGNAGCAAAG